MMNRNSSSPLRQGITTYSRHLQPRVSCEDYSENADIDDNENESEVWDYVPQTSTASGTSQENRRMFSDDHVIDMGHSNMVVDYFPDPDYSEAVVNPEHEDVRNRNDSAYDEQYEVHDSDSPEISPRDDFGMDDYDGGELQSIKVHRPIEMTTFRTYNELTRTSNDMQFDESVPVEDDEGDEIGSGHCHLYGRRGIGPFTPMRKEDQEDYEPSCTPFRPTQTLKQVPVDRTCSIFKSHPRNYGSTSSRDVKIEKSIKPRGGPPFGYPPDQRKLAEKNSALLDSKSSLEEGGGCCQNNDDNVNYIGSMMSDVMTKKKRKKKGKGNDDGSDSEVTDINGNPSRVSRTDFPRSTADFSKFPLNGRPISSLESSRNISSVESDSHEGTHNKRTTRKKKRDQGFVKAGDLYGHKGDQDVEKILSFIEGQDAEKGKKGATISNGPQNGPDKTAVKKNKKNKLVVNNEKDDSGEKVEELSGGSMGNYPSETNKGEDNDSSVVVMKQQGTIDGKKIEKQMKDTKTNSDNNAWVKKVSDKLVKDKGTLKGNEDKSTRDPKELVNGKDIPNKNNVKSKPGRLRKDSVENESLKPGKTEKNSSKESTNGAKTKNEKIAKDSGGREFTRNDSIEKERMETEKQDALKELEVEEVTASVANHIKGVNNFLNVPTNATVASLSLLGDNYRFTDLPVPKVKEEEFTEVRKKKKNKPARDEVPPSRNTTGRYWLGKDSMSTGQVREAPAREHVPREAHRPVAPVAQRSMTPPLAIAAPHPGASAGRSFSPSAFPVLGSSNTRGRRSSAGDAPLETQDDSDLEWVKTLPPAPPSLKDGSPGGGSGSSSSGGGGGGGGGAPAISYARMAAAPTQTINRNKSNSVPNSHVPNFTSVDTPGAVLSSVASATEDVVPLGVMLVNDADSSSESQRLESVLPSSEITRSLPPTVDEFPALDCTPRVDGVASTMPLQAASPKNPADGDIQKTCTVEKQLVNMCTVSPHDIGATRTESVAPSLAPQSGSVENGLANKIPSQPRTCDDLSNLAVPMDAVPQGVSGSVLLPKPATTARTSTPKTLSSSNSSKKLNTKGVIFLDNESDNMDLGISFGSVPPELPIPARQPSDGNTTTASSASPPSREDTHADVANQESLPPASVNISHSGQQQDVSSDTMAVILPPGGPAVEHSSSPSLSVASSDSGHVNGVCNSNPVASPPCSTPSNSCSDSQLVTGVPPPFTVPMMPMDGIAKVARINGIIIPAPLDSDGQFLPIPAGAPMYEDLQFGTVDASMFSQSVPLPVETEAVVLPISDNVNIPVSVVDSAPEPVRTSSYSRDEDPNFERGNFYVEDAIYFLRREWEMTEQKRNNHPNRVFMFKLP